MGKTRSCKSRSKNLGSNDGSAVVEFVLLVIPIMLCLQGVLFVGFESAARVEMLRTVVDQARTIASADFSAETDSPDIEAIESDLRFARIASVHFAKSEDGSKFCAEYLGYWQTSQLCWQAFNEPTF